MAKLTAAARKRIPAGAFALAGRRYPIEDRSHAANALARVSQHGTPAEKATVRRKVHEKYPTMGKPRTKDSREAHGGEAYAYNWRQREGLKRGR